MLKKLTPAAVALSSLLLLVAAAEQMLRCITPP